MSILSDDDACVAPFRTTRRFVHSVADWDIARLPPRHQDTKPPRTAPLMWAAPKRNCAATKKWSAGAPSFKVLGGRSAFEGAKEARPGEAANGGNAFEQLVELEQRATQCARAGAAQQRHQIGVAHQRIGDEAELLVAVEAQAGGSEHRGELGAVESFLVGIVALHR